MLAKKYERLERFVRKELRRFQKDGPIAPEEFDDFIATVLANRQLDEKDKIYCRDGCVWGKRIDTDLYQVICFQINSFGAGIFGDGIVKFSTPLLLTVKVHGSHLHLTHSLRDSCVGLTDLYLSRHYAGSKGPLCQRDKFQDLARQLFLGGDALYSFDYHTVYRLMNANYLCHHIAETMGYAFGAIDVYWARQKELFCMVAGTHYEEKQQKLHIDIIDDFGGDKMGGYFQVPNYVKLDGDPAKFREEFAALTWAISCRGHVDTFLLPIGYQKVKQTYYKQPVNVITSQHIIEHVLTDYYRRPNAFVVASTFQTLEYLSRAMIAKAEGRVDEFSRYMRSVTSCQGYYPERDFQGVLDKAHDRFEEFAGDFTHTMFFRAPVLK